MFAYQERTGMQPKDILKMSYIQFVIGMLDVPSTDYESKKKEDVKKAETVEDQINTMINFLG